MLSKGENARSEQAKREVGSPTIYVGRKKSCEGRKKSTSHAEISAWDVDFSP